MRFNRVVQRNKGFSMVEVIIAMAVFVASITGVSMMLMSGSAAITRGAMESQAAELAQRKIEEVKSLQFYTPWTGANRDIDDFYWAFDGTTPRSNADQFDHPVVEDYETIPHRGQYKRTTAVQYQDVTAGVFSPATMDTNWVPKSMTGNSVVVPLFDLPQNSSSVRVRALVVEVRVSFIPGETGNEIARTSRGVVSDLMVTGGVNNPILVIEEIDPFEGDLHDTNLEMDITVQSQGLQADYDAGGVITASLWYEGQTTIPCKEYEAGAGGRAVVSNNGTNIKCHFNLTDHSYTDWDDGGTVKNVVVRPGVYSLEVYWKNEGWKDTSFRNCFTVVAPPADFDSLTNFNWGHNGQSARQLTINGANLWDATVELTKDSETSIPGNVTFNDGTEIQANFNLASITTVDEYWDVEITTAGGTVISDTNAKRLYANPKPVITRVTPMPNGLSCTIFDWAHAGQTSRHVQIDGHYLYGFDSATTTNRLKYTTRQTSDSGFVSGSTYSDNNAVEGTSVVLDFDPSSGFSSVADRYSTPGTYWDPYLINAGGLATVNTNPQRVLMNPHPVIALINGGGSYADQWGHSGMTSKDVHIAARGAYDTDVAGAECILTSPGGTYSTPNATGAWDTAWHESYSSTTNISGWPTWNLNAAGAGFNEPETMWDLTITNYGGTMTSSSDVMRFEMNPKPIITTVAATSSPSYYDWGYRAQTSRKVRVTGEYLYGFDDGGSERQLHYSGLDTSDATFVNSNDDTYVTLDYNLSSAGADAGENDTRWNAHLANYGGLADYKNAGRVWMNPPPVVSSISSWSTNYTGTGPGGSNPGTTLTLSVTGNYLQNTADGGASAVPTVYIAQTGGVVPYPAGTCIYQVCTGGAVTAAGISDTGLTANISVNPMAFYNLGTGLPATNAQLTPSGTAPNKYGTYYIVLFNVDGQTHTAAGPHHTLTHKSYTLTFGSYQNTVGDTLFGYPSTTGGTYYQDASVTVTPLGGSVGRNGFRDWREGSAVYSSANPLTITAIADKTLKCRFYQYLYHNGEQKVGWFRGYSNDNYQYNINDGGWIKLIAEYHWWEGHGEVSASTNAIDLTNCSGWGIYWKNTDGSNSYSTISIRNSSGGDRNTGTELKERDNNPFGPFWESGSIPAEHRTTNRYLRIHASESWTHWSRVYTRYFWVD